MMLLCDGK